MQRLTWRQVMAWCSEHHDLHRRASHKKMMDVIARIGGLHVQLLSSAELTLWAPVEGLESSSAEPAPDVENRYLLVLP